MLLCWDEVIQDLNHSHHIIDKRTQILDGGKFTEIKSGKNYLCGCALLGAKNV